MAVRACLGAQELMCCCNGSLRVVGMRPSLKGAAFSAWPAGQVFTVPSKSRGRPVQCVVEVQLFSISLKIHFSQLGARFTDMHFNDLSSAKAQGNLSLPLYDVRETLLTRHGPPHHAT